MVVNRGKSVRLNLKSGLFHSFFNGVVLHRQIEFTPSAGSVPFAVYVFHEKNSLTVVENDSTRLDLRSLISVVAFKKQACLLGRYVGPYGKELLRKRENIVVMFNIKFIAGVAFSGSGYRCQFMCYLGDCTGFIHADSPFILLLRSLPGCAACRHQDLLRPRHNIREAEAALSPEMPKRVRRSAVRRRRNRPYAQ